MKGPFLRAEQVRMRNRLKINQKETRRAASSVQLRTGRETLPGPQKGPCGTPQMQTRTEPMIGLAPAGFWTRPPGLWLWQPLKSSSLGPGPGPETNQVSRWSEGPYKYDGTTARMSIMDSPWQQSH